MYVICKAWGSNLKKNNILGLSSSDMSSKPFPIWPFSHKPLLSTIYSRVHSAISAPQCTKPSSLRLYINGSPLFSFSPLVGPHITATSPHLPLQHFIFGDLAPFIQSCLCEIHVNSALQCCHWLLCLVVEHSSACILLCPLYRRTFEWSEWSHGCVTVTITDYLRHP